MASIRILPNIFRWAFTVLAGLTAFAAAIVFIAILVDPHVPADTALGPFTLDVLDQPATLGLRPEGGDFAFSASAFRGTVTLELTRAGGLIERVKHYGLPLVLANLLFLTALFELLRRLFRNVGRGESFSAPTVRLVQMLGGALIAFSFVSAFVEGLFTHAVFAYFADHAAITIAGSALHLPPPHYVMFPGGGGFPFGSPLFFTGLLVLALSEVFRQGLALQREHELTI